MARIVASLLRQFGPAGSIPAAPDVPTFSVADNGDGSGGVVTVAGSSAGSANTFFAARWSGGFEEAPFADYGSRTGNGTLAIAIASGTYWGFVRSELAGQIVDSLVGGFRITEEAESVYYRCLTAIAAKIQALSLAGIAGSSIVVRKTPWNRNFAAPGIFITPTREASFAPATNQRDDVTYGVQITIVRAGNEELASGLGALLAWREEIARALRQDTLAGVAEVYTVRVEAGPTIDRAALDEQYDVETLMVTCVSREPRAS